MRCTLAAQNTSSSKGVLNAWLTSSRLPHNTRAFLFARKPGGSTVQASVLKERPSEATFTDLRPVERGTVDESWISELTGS